MAAGEASDLRRVAVFRASSVGIREDRESVPLVSETDSGPFHNPEERAMSGLGRSASLPHTASLYGHFETSSLSSSLDRTRSGRSFAATAAERVPAQVMAARMLRRSGSAAAAHVLVRQRSRAHRSLMRQESMMVRESAALQVEDMQSELANSRVLMLAVICWNLACIIAIAIAFPLTWMETTTQPLRLWLVGYMVQCSHHIWRSLILWRSPPRRPFRPAPASPTEHPERGEEHSGERDYPASPPSARAAFLQGSFMPWGRPLTRSFSDVSDRTLRCALQFETVRPLLSFLWWLGGLVWLSASDMALAESPLIYWLCLLLLALDAFYICFCMSLAFLIGIAVCFYLPGIITMLQQVSNNEEGALLHEINALPRFKFRLKGGGPDDVEAGEARWGRLVPIGHTDESERLNEEDAECCICLDSYVDDCDVRRLPCCHHYHTPCIDAWLQINSTCPLCKFDVAASRKDLSP